VQTPVGSQLEYQEGNIAEHYHCTRKIYQPPKLSRYSVTIPLVTFFGSAAPRWPVFAWYAAGGLRSTAQDMISFGEAYLGHKEVNDKPVSAELIAVMQLAQKPIYTMPNGNKQAMAWVNNMGGGNPNLHPVIVKNGGTAGFGNVIAINPTKGRGHLHRHEPGRS
jgi:CubicO group peptidase (beta-lactamase class C family)